MDTARSDFTASDVTLGAIRYNAQKGMFEARVDVRRGDRTFRYPCQISAPIDVDSGWIASRLTQQALGQSDSLNQGDFKKN